MEVKTVHYTVKQVAALSGVSVRTLHLYDEIGLLKPSIRTEARYRLYGEPELLRLQQILFYKELDFTLEQIGKILDDPEFDLNRAMESHRAILEKRRNRINTLIQTIDKTIQQLNKTTMLKPEELYEGLLKEVSTTYRDEAIQEYGKETIERSEKNLMQMGKEGFEQLKKDLFDVNEILFGLMKEDHTSKAVQLQVAKHYEIIRKFWGTAHSTDKQTDAYKGLGQLYVADERFTVYKGQPQPAYALFISKAMAHFADNQLK